MSDVWSQALPAVTALAGVTVTFGGTLTVERQKWRRTRRSQLVDRALEVFGDLLQATTDIARTIRQAAEQIHHRSLTDFERVTYDVDELIGQARKLGTMARFVGPPDAVNLLDDLERVMAPLYELIVETGQAVDYNEPATLARSDDLVEAAEALMRQRDSIIAHLRDPAGLGIDR